MFTRKGNPQNGRILNVKSVVDSGISNRQAEFRESEREDKF